jgi:pentatricopeptide repeat protein
LDPTSKITKIMELYKLLIKLKSKVLSERTYTGLVELFMSNGYLEHASYFLCQMDRQKLKIPRNLLDLFLEFSVKNRVFESAEIQDLNAIPNHEPKAKPETLNKFDQYEPQNDPDYVYYFSKRNLYKKRKDMNNLLSGLKVDAKPFFPRSVDSNVEKMKSKLSEIDHSKVKEFIPKSYKIEKKN